MPERDGTGPKGKGPMTGRGSGQCVIPLNTAEEEFEFLQNQERALRKQLRHVGSRMKRVQQENMAKRS
jgi:hypothetical protein